MFVISYAIHAIPFSLFNLRIRRRMQSSTKRVNAAICLACGDLLISSEVHNFIVCQCKAIFIDGGDEYKKRGNLYHFIHDVPTMGEYIEYQSLSKEERRAKLIEGYPCDLKERVEQYRVNVMK